MLPNEMIPCAFVPERARTRQREVGQVKLRQIAIELLPGWLGIGECAAHAGHDGVAEHVARHLPPAGVSLTKQTVQGSGIEDHGNASAGEAADRSAERCRRKNPIYSP
jgi:hypothetical protein